MLVAALFRHDRVPENVLHLAVDGVAVEVAQAERRPGQDGHIAIGEKKHVARVAEDGGHVGRDEVFALADADHDRRPVRARRRSCSDRRAKSPPARRRRVSCLTAARTACSRLPSKYFSTRCAMTSVSVSVLKSWPSRCELLLRAADSFRRCRCAPPRCRRCNRGADGRSLRWAGRAWPSGCGRCRTCHRRDRLDDVFEVAQLARSAADAELIVVAIDGEPGGVITAILETLEAFQNDGNGLMAPDIAYDSAHILIIVAPPPKDPALRRQDWSWYDSSGKTGAAFR